MRKALCVELYASRLRIRIGKPDEFDGYTILNDAIPKISIDQWYLESMFHWMGLVTNPWQKGDAEYLNIHESLADYTQGIGGDDGIVTDLRVIGDGSGILIKVTVDNGHGESWTHRINYQGPYAILWDTDGEDKPDEYKDGES